MGRKKDRQAVEQISMIRCEIPRWNGSNDDDISDDSGKSGCQAECVPSLRSSSFIFWVYQHNYPIIT